MRLYRIYHSVYLDNLTGRGASYMNGGRWNRPAVPVLYFAESPSVAMLGLANYLPSPRLIPPTYRLGICRIKEGCPHAPGATYKQNPRINPPVSSTPDQSGWYRWITH